MPATSTSSIRCCMPEMSSHDDRFWTTVHDKEAFTQQIMPRYFETSTWKSFQRNINLWNFHTIRKGNNKGYTTHPSFRRGRVQLCNEMTRVRVKGTGKKRGGTALDDREKSLSSEEDGLRVVSEVPNAITLLTPTAGTTHQSHPLWSLNFVSSTELSTTDVTNLLRITGNMLNQSRWLDSTSCPAPGFPSFTEATTAFHPIFGTTNGMPTQSSVITALLSKNQQDGLLGNRNLVGFPFGTSGGCVNAAPHDIIMDGLLRIALNSKRSEAPPTSC